MPSTIRDVVTSAYRELGIAPLVGDLPAELALLGLNTLNRILDSWNAQREAAYAEAITTGITFSASTNPHTLGPSGATWTFTQRPEEILSLSFTSDGTAWTPIDIISRAEYDEITTPGLTSTHPNVAYYNRTWPNGSLYLYPVPTSAYAVELIAKRVLASVVLGDSWSFPPGYQDAIQKTLKEELVAMPMFASAANAEIKDAAGKARAVIFANNDAPPRLTTADSGMPRGGGYFDYRSGSIR
jgi:hypothetical protein